MILLLIIFLSHHFYLSTCYSFKHITIGTLHDYYIYNCVFINKNREAMNLRMTHYYIFNIRSELTLRLVSIAISFIF